MVESRGSKIPNTNVLPPSTFLDCHFLHRPIVVLDSILTNKQPPSKLLSQVKRTQHQAMSADEKIIDLLKKKPEEQTTPFLSLEYFPPRTEEGVKVCVFV